MWHVSSGLSLAVRLSQCCHLSQQDVFSVADLNYVAEPRVRYGSQLRSLYDQLSVSLSICLSVSIFFCIYSSLFFCVCWLQLSVFQLLCIHKIYLTLM